MGFYQTKSAFREVLRPLARRTLSIHPDVWTWVAVGVSGLAGALFCMSPQRPGALLVIPALLVLRLVLNVFDGLVAQEAGVSSARGEALSEFADRLSDVAILGGFAVAGLGRGTWATAAIIVVLLVSHVGILGKAVGAGRQYGGLMGKPDRMVALIVACLAQFAVAHGWWALPPVGGYELTVFDWASVAMIGLGVYTIIVRLVTILRDLAAG